MDDDLEKALSIIRKYIEEKGITIKKTIQELSCLIMVFPKDHPCYGTIVNAWKMLKTVEENQDETK